MEATGAGYVETPSSINSLSPIDQWGTGVEAVVELICSTQDVLNELRLRREGGREERRESCAGLNPKGMGDTDA